MCTYPDVWGLRVALEIGVQSLTFYVGLGIPRAGGQMEGQGGRSLALCLAR